VVHHGLHASSDRLKPGQPHQVHCCGSQRGNRAGAISPVVMGILKELGIANPVPALNTSTVPHQLQQGFWGGAQAGSHRQSAITAIVGPPT
jgi:hypothetical protein